VYRSRSSCVHCCHAHVPCGPLYAALPSFPCPLPPALAQVTKRDDPDEAKVEALRGVAGEGEKVWVKVISVVHDPERGAPKVGCSMKLVSQSDGADKDPSNLKLAEQSKPQSRGPQKVRYRTIQHYSMKCYTLLCSTTVRYRIPQCIAVQDRTAQNTASAVHVQCAFTVIYRMYCVAVTC